MSKNLAKSLPPMPDERPDIRKIMTEIRERVREDLEKNRDKRTPFRPKAADFDTSPQARAGELLNSEELRYLNQNYAYSWSARLNLDSISSHRPGILGRAIVKVKRKLLCILWDNLLKDYFESEKEYQANLVRYLNHVSKYVDSRDAANFWELIRKIDYDVQKALDRIERINDEQTASMRSSERRAHDTLDGALGNIRENLARLNTFASQSEDKLKTLESVARGVESVVARASRKEAPSGETVEFSSDQSYVLLENRYRGGEEDISERLSIYPVIFKGAKAPILEIGPGRGELQILFRNAGIPSYGIDFDEAMVEAAKKKGVDARYGDGIAHLRGLPDRSIGGVIAIQVVEHLTWGQLKELFDLCSKKVVVGGKVVFETINPRSLLALSSNYFRDPTHVWPLHPDTLSYSMTLSGLRISEVRDLSPVPDEAQLRKVPVEEYMTPKWTYTVETINRNLEQLNQLLYGYQDYCVVAEVV